MSGKSTFEYPGQQATVSWSGKHCIHVAECGRASGDLFIGGRKPWCQPDLVSKDEVVDVVLRCPSGALSVRFADGSYTEQAPARNSIQVTYNGPLFIKGKLDIEGAPGDVPALGYRAALCRCGLSANKPFCDNSHESGGFRDYGAVGQSASIADDGGGTLTIKPSKDGPLLISGNVTIYASSGRRAWQGKKAALCRCGSSNNKPFCDGEHKKAGFKSD